MKFTTIKTERLLLLVVITLIIVSMLPRRCSSSQSNTEPIVTVIRDTVWQVKTDTFNVQTVRYKTVYVRSENPSKIINDTSELDDLSGITEARIYQDTLSNDDIDIYSYNLLMGSLLDSELSYTLKVPREITITKTIEHPKRFRSGLYLFGEVGGSTSSFDNISMGLQYNRKGNWFVGYRINMNQLQNPTHNVSAGFRLFK